MEAIERWAIEETLKLTAGNREEAAKILAIGARTCTANWTSIAMTIKRANR